MMFASELLRWSLKSARFARFVHDIYPWFARFVHDQHEFKTNFESILYELVYCFKLIVFGFGISCMILMLFISSFYHICLIMVMWFVGTKEACFRGIKSHFLGLAAWSLFLGLLGSVLCVFEKNIVLALWFETILVQFFETI
jgi:hypothetical protein